MNKVSLVCLIGIPASGKTVLSKELKSMLESNEGYNFYVEIVCFDDFEGFNNAEGNWKCKRKSVFEEVENIIDFSKTSAIKKNMIIILDDNMYYRSMRYDYVKLAKFKNIGFCQIYLEADLNSCIEMNFKRSKPVPVRLIKNMFRKIEKPCPDKYNWELKSILLKSYCDLNESISSVITLLSSSLDEPLNICMNNTTIPKPSHSESHVADIALRRLVSCKMRNFKSLNANGGCLSKLSSCLNQEKIHLFTAMKTGQLIIPDNLVSQNLSQEEKVDLYYDFFSSLMYL